MLKHLHLLLVVMVFISFTGRILLAELSPERLRQKWLKVTPHLIDTLLLLSGIALIFQGDWLSRDYGWIVAKLILLTVYIGLGMVAMRKTGLNRRLASIVAIVCLLIIAKIASGKQFFWFF